MSRKRKIAGLAAAGLAALTMSVAACGGGSSEAAPSAEPAPSAGSDSITGLTPEEGRELVERVNNDPTVKAMQDQIMKDAEKELEKALAEYE